MRYYGTVIRPPSEAESYILQVTYGCSHNLCTFCGTYLDKPFQTRPDADVRQDIDLARQLFPDTRRVFLADGNALVLSARRLVPLLDALAAAFPNLQRVAAYANAQDLLRKNDDELKLLRERGLRLACGPRRGVRCDPAGASGGVCFGKAERGRYNHPLPVMGRPDTVIRPSAVMRRAFRRLVFRPDPRGTESQLT